MRRRGNEDKPAHAVGALHKISALFWCDALILGVVYALIWLVDGLGVSRKIAPLWHNASRSKRGGGARCDGMQSASDPDDNPPPVSYFAAATGAHAASG